MKPIKENSVQARRKFDETFKREAVKNRVLQSRLKANRMSHSTLITEFVTALVKLAPVN